MVTGPSPPLHPKPQKCVTKKQMREGGFACDTIEDIARVFDTLAVGVGKERAILNFPREWSDARMAFTSSNKKNVCRLFASRRDWVGAIPTTGSSTSPGACASASPGASTSSTSTASTTGASAGDASAGGESAGHATLVPPPLALSAGDSAGCDEDPDPDSAPAARALAGLCAHGTAVQIVRI